MIFLNFSSIDYIHHLIKYHKNTLVIFIYNLKTFFKYDQRLLRAFLLNVRKKKSLKARHVVVQTKMIRREVTKKIHQSKDAYFIIVDYLP